MMRATFAQARQRVELDSVDLVDLSATPWRRIMLSARDNVWCLVDAIDYEWLSAHIWNVWHAGKGRGLEWQLYAKRNEGDRRRTVRMHREILIAAEAPPAADAEAFLKRMLADHINGQTLDNRRANLRWATKRENNMNRRAQGTAPSLESIVLELLAGLGPRPKLQEVPF